MSPVKPALAALCGAGAAWLSLATLALTGAAFSTDRIAILPVSIGSLSLVAAVATAVGLAVWRSRRAGVLVLCSLIVLPWLPTGVPPAFLLWSGPMAVLPWVAIVLSALAEIRPVPRWPVKQDPAIAGAIAFVVFSVSAWSASPSVPGGDEPHYLIITQSLIEDGDLRIENNHARRDYREYFPGDLRPDFLKRGLDGEIYSIHAPGLPALVVPAYLAGGYRGVILSLILVSALGSALAWRLGWLATARRDAAWFGWSAVTLAATTVFHSFSVYPDGPGGVLVLTGVWALLRAGAERELADVSPRPWILHGAALALLPWLHSRFAVLAGILGVLVVLRLLQSPNGLRKIVAFAIVPAVSCAGWFYFFIAIYGTPSPAAPYGGQIGSMEFVADGLAGLLFDQRFGLLAYAPVLVCALFGLVAMVRSPSRGAERVGMPRLALELVAVLVPYLLTVTYFRMWWGGWSAPARFAVPVVFVLAVPAAAAWASMSRRGTRATSLAALASTVFATGLLVFVDGGRLAFNVRTEPAQLLDWLSRSASLVTAFPAWSDRETDFFRDIAIWIVAMALAGLGVRAVDRSAAFRNRQTLATVTAIMFAVAAMVAATLVWRVNDLDGTRPLPGQMDLLRRTASAERAVGVGLQPLRLVSGPALTHGIRLRPDPIPPPEEGATGDRVLFAIPAVPAGTYNLRPRATREGGRLTVAIGRGGHVIQTLPATGAATITLPVDVRAIVIGADDSAQKVVRGLTLEPISIASAGERPSEDFARDAVQYGDHTVFFLDENSFPEPDAFWVRGGHRCAIVIQSDTPRPTATLVLGNAPVANRVVLEAANWRTELQLSPGEERVVTVPLASASATLVRLSASDGFVPSRVDPASRDNRFLGVYVRVN